MDLCNPAEQLLWARLSVFTGSVGLEAIEAVYSDDLLAAADVLDVLSDLVDKSVLVRDDQHTHVRYRMLETIRQYGRLRLSERGELSALRRRHRDYYQWLLSCAEREWFTAEQTAWAARLHEERPNLRAALDFCLNEPGETQAGLWMSAALWSHRLGEGSLEEERHWLARTLAADITPSLARARAAWADGWLTLLRGDYEPARSRAAQPRAGRVSSGHAYGGARGTARWPERPLRG
ncbi:hypothetical protein [Streptomyces yangpuensis]|uniref:hypothetical protein n=1 Tax=Streptomyces yangpuensis TaxID=1648182 RepID=UPI00381F1962